MGYCTPRRLPVYYTGFPNVGGEELAKKAKHEINPLINGFIQFCMGETMELPPEMIPFFLRDILHYTKEEVDMLDYKQYNLAVIYSVFTYTQRNMMLLLSKIFRKGGVKSESKEGDELLTFTVEQPEMMEWLEKYYDSIKKGEKFEFEVGQ